MVLLSCVRALVVFRGETLLGLIAVALLVAIVVARRAAS
jgi:hypothetical protein